MLKVGIIGTGRIFDLNVLGYLNNEDVEITCLCNRNIEKAKIKSKEFSLKKDIHIYSDYKKMFLNENLDIVEILLPHHLHAEAVIEAAQNGIKGISVQKPMALSLEDADKMIQSCDDSDSILSIYENFIFSPHIIRAKKLIKQKKIGDILTMRIKVIMGSKGGWRIPESAKKWRNNPMHLGGAPKKGSPVLLDNGWHAFSLGYWFLDKKIEKVHAITDDYNNIDTPAYVIWKYKEDNNEHSIISQYGKLESCFMPEMEIPSKYYSTDEFIEFNGTEGMMWINQCTSMGNKMTNSGIFPAIVIYKEGNIQSFSNFNKDWKYSFINATKYFINIIKNGGEPILSGKMGRYILKFNLAAIKSALTNKEVFLDEN
ncbi:MAG: Gfo/Idh/MocA family protein [Promethearchaeota archaeon]